MPVSITEEDDKIVVATPYHPDFPNAARRLNGRWTGSVWKFDKRDTERVKQICRDIYGSDGSSEEIPDLVDVRVTALTDVSVWHHGVYVGGRCVAWAAGRDTGAKLGDRVVVVEGESPTSGGSRANWTTVIPQGCVLEIRDLPRAAMKKIDPDTWNLQVVKN